MQTECSGDRFGFARVGGRVVVAGFDGGRVTSEAGAMLLGATDRVRSPRAKPAGHKAYSEISKSYARSRHSAGIPHSR
jgi:hypothetical protein